MLGVEKVVTSKLYEPGVNRRLYIIDDHIGMVWFNSKTLTLRVKVFIFLNR